MEKIICFCSCVFQKVNKLHYSFIAPGHQNISETHLLEIKLLLRELMRKCLGVIAGMKQII